MKSASTERAVAFTPGLGGSDETAAYWLLQVNLRLRREICWRWHLRGELPLHANALPPAESPLMVSLDLARHARAKLDFFRTDITARYLTEHLATPEPEGRAAAHGSFGWVARMLSLSPVDRFALALAVSAAVDGALGPVIAACLDDATRTTPSLGLIQRLWDDASEAAGLADPWHALWRHALMHVQPSPAINDGLIEWSRPFITPALIARHLLFPDAPLPEMLAPLAASSPGEISGDVAEQFRPAIARLRTGEDRHLRIVPVLGPRSVSSASAVAYVAGAVGRPVCSIASRLVAADGALVLRSLAVLCWLSGYDLLIQDPELLARSDESASLALSTLRGLPLIVYVPVTDGAAIAALPRDLVQPVIPVTGLDHGARVALWRSSLGRRGAGLGDAVDECSRRFRYERERIITIAQALRSDPEPITKDRLMIACRAEIQLDIGHLAQEVSPRFRDDELVLPPAQRTQFDEVARAMQSLTAVHYQWGMGRAWNECGISVLFAGAPGTGKTMAAEVLATSLEMPMYRIDLSQVVNKYIGETEKNLKRVFDVADAADTILFFDECDALFGRRTEVKDAHDRYANVEISYLLERMERFKGLAILATNRRKDIDEAFLRRLRYIVEFPMPGVCERRSLWARMMPAAIDSSDVDIDFLARQFPLAGGHIRSIIMNACLQSAGGARAKEKRLTMSRVVVAVHREYEKLGRSVTVEQFGPHSSALQASADA
ncbi:MAG: ATP-binding protein [Gemmatimonadaceae bacterium]